MGNRGVLHSNGRIVKDWDIRRWIVCGLTHPSRNRKVPQWKDGSYTVLFFLDEAVAFAAGHRPCHRCRGAAYKAWKEAWAAAFGERAPSADDMDARLHRDRLDGDRQRIHDADWGSVPAGAYALDGDDAVLVRDDHLVPWTPSGHGEPRPRPRSGRATLLTPELTVDILRAGYPIEMGAG